MDCCRLQTQFLLGEITGDMVKAGEVIARSGNTGEFTTGWHLHFELWFNGYSVDPTNFIEFSHAL